MFEEICEWLRFENAGNIEDAGVEYLAEEEEEEEEESLAVELVEGHMSISVFSESI